MNQYRLQKKKGDGTFSEVFMAKSITTGEYCAIKCIKDPLNSIEEVMKNAEISALKKLSPHDNIIKLLKVLYDQPTSKLALVFELMDMNLYQCLKSNKAQLTHHKIKLYMFQLLRAIAHIHKKGIFHRDIKPENILVKGDTVKLADFGSCEGCHSKAPRTSYIATRWYRAPECLLTDGYYDHKMDIWGFGCVLFELVARYPLFPGKDQLDQIHKIHTILGTPPQELLAEYQSKATHMEFNFPQKKARGIKRLLPANSDFLLDLLTKTLAYNPTNRISAEQALQHEYFSQIATLFQSKQQEISKRTKSHLSSLTQSVSVVSEKEMNQIQHAKTKQIVGNIPSNSRTLMGNKSLKKQQSSKVSNAQYSSCLPLIPQVRLNLKVNIYANATMKLDKKLTVVKKTDKEKDQLSTLYPLVGKRIGRF